MIEGLRLVLLQPANMHSRNETGAVILFNINSSNSLVMLDFSAMLFFFLTHPSGIDVDVRAHSQFK